MSRLQSLSSRRRYASLRRQVWGDLFGSFLRDARVTAGRSVEQAAAAAGISTAEWEGVEAGQVPRTWHELCQMAEALRTGRNAMASLVIFCQEAWNE